MNSRQALQQDINQLTSKIYAHKVKLADDTNYFRHYFNNKLSFLVIMLIPPFLLGWELAKPATLYKDQIQAVGRFVFFNVFLRTLDYIVARH